MSLAPIHVLQTIKRWLAAGGYLATGSAAGGDLAGSTYPNPTIGAGRVTLAKMADIASMRLIGRAAAGVGVPEALPVTPAGLSLIGGTISCQIDQAHPGFGAGALVTVPTTVISRRVVAIVNIGAAAGDAAFVTLEVETGIASAAYLEVASARQPAADIIVRQYLLAFDVPGGRRYRFLRSGAGGTTETSARYGWTES